MSNRTRRTVAAAALAAGLYLVPAARAANLFWQATPADNDISGANYYNGSATVAPAAGDILFIGANGNATGTASLTVGKLYVGHANTGGGATAPAGPATVSINGGTFTASTGAGGSGNFATIVGFGDNGTLNIDGASTAYSSNRMTVGYGNDLAKSATLNITNSPNITISGGNLVVGDSPDSGVGIPGHVNVASTTLDIKSILQVGVRASGSSYTQTSGATTLGSNFVIGLNGTDNCSFTMAGGTLTTTATSNVSNGTVLVENTTASFTGGTSTLVGFNVANGLANNTTLAVSGTATLNVTGDLSVTTGASDNATANTFMTLADTAAVNVSSNFFFGRGSTTNTQLTITGGTLTVGNNFYVGNAVGATGIVINHSAGAVVTQNSVNPNNGNLTNFSIGESNTGDATYNLSGTGSVTTVARGVVGKTKGSGAFNQSGGTANFNNSLHIGDSQGTDPANNSTGTYTLSGGTLAVTLPVGSPLEAFSIAPAGTGTFTVLGDGATMTVTGDMGVYANTNGGTSTGTLAYQLQPGESLTRISVSGNATFNLGSVLSLDLNSVTPAASYDLLTAADVIDNGLTFTAPAGWSYRIVPGGNGELLQAYLSAPPRITGDTNGDGVVDLSDLNNVLNNFGSNTPGNPGDDNGDNIVDLQDLNNVLNNFGAHAAAAALSVPEPASLAACAVAATTLATRRRRT